MTFIEEKRPKVGLGVIIVRDRKVLLGKRKGTHGPGTWCFPGGHLEYKESWADCARRETMEESGLEINNIRFVTATNDIHDDGSHYITVLMRADPLPGEARIMEPDKCEGWDWFSWDKLPSPLFLSCRQLVEQGYNGSGPEYSVSELPPKLVRDRIPEIIRADGKEPIMHTANETELKRALTDKLKEEVREYLASGSLEELADIQEVLLALSYTAGATPEKMERLRKKKAEERGAFTKRLIWTGNK